MIPAYLAYFFWTKLQGIGVHIQAIRAQSIQGKFRAGSRCYGLLIVSFYDGSA